MQYWDKLHCLTIQTGYLYLLCTVSITPRSIGKQVHKPHASSQDTDLLTDFDDIEIIHITAAGQKQVLTNASLNISWSLERAAKALLINIMILKCGLEDFDGTKWAITYRNRMCRRMLNITERLTARREQ